MTTKLSKTAPARTRIAVLAIAVAAVLTTGCTVYTSPTPPPPPGGPVVDGPGVVVIQQEPPYDQRYYVYDPGYPPGTYYYNGYYYYGGYAYPRDVFVDRYVAVNIRDHRYLDRNENLRNGRAFEDRARGQGPRGNGRPDDRHER